MGQLFCSACAGLTGKHKHRVFPSCCWQRPARLRKTCYHSCDADSVQESRRFWCFANFGQQRVNVFFSCEMKILVELAKSCCQPKPRPSLRSIFLSVIGLWVYDLSKERASAQIWIKKHNYFRWQHANAWEQCQTDWVWFWINHNQKFAAKLVANEIQCLKAM